MRRFPAAVLTCAALWCATPPSAARTAQDADLNAWPLLTVNRDEAGTEITVLGPVGEYSNVDDHRVLALRPLYIRHHYGPRQYSHDLVWPFAAYRREQGDVDARVFPLFWGWDEEGRRYVVAAPLLWTWWYTPRNGIGGFVLVPSWFIHESTAPVRWSRGIFPLWLSRTESYRTWIDGATAPFSHTGARWVVERTDWIAPFYRSKDSEGTRTTGLLPLWLSWVDGERRGTWLAPAYWGRGPEGIDSAVVFPIYWQGRNHRVVFPLYWAFDEGRTLVFFPLWGRFRRGNAGWDLYAWPAYTRHWRDGYKGHDLFWPLLGWGGDGAQERRFHLWPLFGTTTDRTHAFRRQDRWLLWPLIWWSRTDPLPRSERRAGSAPYCSQSFAVAPLVWCGTSEVLDVTSDLPVYQDRHRNVFPLYWSGSMRTRQVSPTTGASVPAATPWSERHHNWLIPLYTWNREDQRMVFTALWPLWYCANDPSLEQQSVLWRLVDIRRQPDGARLVRVLWRAWRDESRAGMRKVDAFPFLSYRRETGNLRRGRFLGGLVEVGNDAGQRYLRLFYSPRIGLGRGPLP